MLQTTPLSVLDPKVRRVKERFETYRRNNYLAKPIAFETFLGPFSEPVIDFYKLSQETGLSVKSLARIYDTWFEELLGEKTVAKSRAYFVAQRQEKKLGERWPALRLVIDSARASGCAVRHVVTSEPLRTRLLVNRALCVVHLVELEHSARQACESPLPHKVVGRIACHLGSNTIWVTTAPIHWRCNSRYKNAWHLLKPKPAP